MGHTVNFNKRISIRLDGKVIMIDTGMLNTVYTGGIASALVVEKVENSAFYLGQGGGHKILPLPRQVGSRPAAMSDDDLFSILFQPGFSTAKAVTDISGRGVGMDVAKKDIEKLGGNIKIYSTPGKGTSIRLRLPLTLVIIKALLVRVCNNIYILPINNVLQSFRINEDQIKMVDKKETCILRYEVIPLARLDQLFEIESIHHAFDNGLFVIIVEHKDKHIGLIVDELVGQQEVVIKSLGASLGRVQGFAGATIIKDGSVALILDINSLLI